ncbi:MAG: hypothetical protein IT380_16420 [Myxococcales bacterium]|nr:hypothetical protein [Myxococcales bacterium]
MPRIDALAALSSTAGASREPTTETKSLYAADMEAAEPLSARFRAHVKPSRRFIAVDSEERTPHGTLRCFARDERVVVEVRRGRALVGRALWVKPASPALLQPGALIPEDGFAVEIPEFLGSPWHEDDYVSVWTVRGLREKGSAEAWVDV